MKRNARKRMTDDKSDAADLIFREMVAIFESTDAMAMGIEERLRLCSNAAVLSLRQAGLILDGH
jgi:hypothetical protein